MSFFRKEPTEQEKQALKTAGTRFTKLGERETTYGAVMLALRAGLANDGFSEREIDYALKVLFK